MQKWVNKLNKSPKVHLQKSYFLEDADIDNISVSNKISLDKRKL